MGKTTKIRLTEEEARAEEGANRPPTPLELTPQQQEQIRFRQGNRKQRRMIAKRNGFYKDKTGTAWRESNKMIRKPNSGDVQL